MPHRAVLKPDMIIHLSSVHSLPGQLTIGLAHSLGVGAQFNLVLPPLTSGVPDDRRSSLADHGLIP